MYNLSEVLTCIDGEIGWRNSNNPCDKPLSSDITSSSEDVYYNDIHPLLTYENIKSVAINPNEYNIENWDVATTYNTGDKVRIQQGSYFNYYTSLIDNNLGIDPETNPNEWQENEYLSDWYKQKTNNSVNNVFRKLTRIKEVKQKTKTLLDNFILFKNVGRIKDLITPSNRFVGYYIQLYRAEHIVSVISQIGLQLTTPQTLNIYLYHSSQEDPLQIIPITTTSASSFQWSNTDIVMQYLSENYDTGAFFLGYYEEDLSGQAINKRLNWDKPCGGCQGWKPKDYRTYSQFVKIYPVSVAEDNLEADRSMFDINDIRYTNNINYGLNLNYKAKCDWTRFICDNTYLYTDIIRTQVAKDFLTEMLFSTRDNNLQEKINAAIQGNEEVQSIDEILENDYKGVNFEMSDLGSPCMPCENQKGIRQRAL